MSNYVSIKFKGLDAVSLSKGGAKHSVMLRDLMAENPGGPEIVLDGVEDGTVFPLMAQWMDHHKEIAPVDGTPAEETTEVTLTEWDRRFLDQMAQNELFKLFKLAFAMNVGLLKKHTAKKISSLLENKKPEEIRETFHISNDFTPTEEAALKEDLKFFFNN